MLNQWLTLQIWVTWHDSIASIRIPLYAIIWSYI